MSTTYLLFYDHYEPSTTMTHYWRLHCRLPERNGQPCRILARGKMNSIMIEFEDGARYVVSRYAVRTLGPHRAKQS